MVDPVKELINEETDIPLPLAQRRQLDNRHCQPVKKILSEGASRHDYERENNYPIYWAVTEGLKREMIANGTS